LSTPFDPAETVPAGAVRSYDGGLWTAQKTVPANIPPLGIGDGSAHDQALLVGRAKGFADWVTGGQGKPLRTVTNANDSGAGSFRQAVADAKAAGGGWITFSKTFNLVGGVPTYNITLTSDWLWLAVQNVTVDARGIALTVNNGGAPGGIGVGTVPFVFAIGGSNYSDWTSNSITQPCSNLIFTNVRFASNAGGESNNTGTHDIVTHRLWTRGVYWEFSGFTNPDENTDGLCDIGYGSQDIHFSWCNFFRHHKALLWWSNSVPGSTGNMPPGLSVASPGPYEVGPTDHDGSTTGAILRASADHCLVEEAGNRAPEVRSPSAKAHVWNSWILNWGSVSAGTPAFPCYSGAQGSTTQTQVPNTNAASQSHDIDSAATNTVRTQLRLDNNIYTPAAGASAGALLAVKGSSYGADAGLTGYSGLLRESGATADTNNTVFNPSPTYYTYTLDTADATLKSRIQAGAKPNNGLWAYSGPDVVSPPPPPPPPSFASPTDSTIVVRTIDSVSGLPYRDLPDYQRLTITPVFSDVGMFTMEYPSNGVNANLVTPETEVAFYMGGSEIPDTRSFIEEHSVDEASTAEDGALITLGGRTALSLLDDAIVYPQNWPASSNPATHSFIAATPGKVLGDLMTRAKARNALGKLVKGAWNDTTDSNGVTWASVNASLTITYDAGVTLAQVLQGMVAQGLVEARMLGRTLELYTTGTLALDLTTGPAPLVFRKGENLTDSPRKTSTRDLKNAVLVAGDGGVYIEAADPTSIAGRGRREGSASNGQTADIGTLSAFGQAQILLLREKVEKTCGLVLNGAIGSRYPFKDFNLGDWGYVDTKGAGLERLRIKQWSITVDTDGNITGSVSLNDLIDEWEERVQSWLTGITTGVTSPGQPGSPPPTPPGGSDAIAPLAPTGVTVSSVTYTDTQGDTAAAMTIGWLAVTQNADGTPITDLSGYEAQYKLNTSTGPAPNLVGNPGFEGVGGVGDTTGWQGNASGWDTSTVTLSSNLAFVDSGAHSGILTFPTPVAGTSGMLYRVTGLTVGAGYTFTVRVLSPGGSTPSPDVQAVCYSLAAGTIVTTKDVFATATVTFTATATAHYVGVQNTSAYTSGKRIFVDNASLTLTSLSDPSLGVWTPLGRTDDTQVSTSPLVPGASVTARVRAVDTSSNRSAWGYSNPTTLAIDNTPPPIPSTPTLVSRLGQVEVGWNGFGSQGEPMPADFAYCEVHVGTSNGFTPVPSGAGATLVGRINFGRGAVVVSTLSYGTTYYFRLVAVDEQGNRSTPSTTASTDVQPLVDSDIIGQILNGAKIIPGSIVASQSIIGSTITGGLIQGLTITGDKIAGNTIQANNIAAGAITTEKIGLGVLSTNLVVNPGFENIGITNPVPQTYQQVPGWTLTQQSGSSVQPWVEYQTGNQDPRSGLSKAVLPCPGAVNGSYAVSDPMAVLAGQDYVFTAFLSGQGRARVRLRTAPSNAGPWAEQSDGFGDDQTGSGYLLNQTDGTYVVATGVKTIPTTHTWAQIIIYNIQSGTSGFFPNQQTLMYVDDASLTRLGYGAMELTGAGMRMFDELGNETMNLTGAGAGGNYLTIQNAGVAMVQLTADGNITGLGTGSFGALEVGGDALDTIIDKRGRGMQTHWGVLASSQTIGSGATAAVMEMAVEVEAGRHYELHVSNLLVNNAGTTGYWQSQIRDGGTSPPTTSSTILAYGSTPAAQGAFVDVGPIIRGFRGVASGGSAAARTLDAGIHRLLICVNNQSGASGSIYSSAGTNWVEATFVDLGPVTADTGVSQSGSGGGTSLKLTYQPVYNATFGQTYDGDGSKNTATANLGQGLRSAQHGNERSVIGFPSTTIISDLSGATVSKIEVYLVYYYWYYGQGTAVIGSHSLGGTTAPTTFTGGTPNLIQSAAWRSGFGKWVDITASHPAASWAAGTIRGIMLGPGSTTSKSYVGAAQGVSSPHPPLLRFTYVK